MSSESSAAAARREKINLPMAAGFGLLLWLFAPVIFQLLEAQIATGVSAVVPNVPITEHGAASVTQHGQASSGPSSGPSSGMGEKELLTWAVVGLVLCIAAIKIVGFSDQGTEQPTEGGALH